ncbi:unnamed protein product, partial [Prorocentrum cordatum]
SVIVACIYMAATIGIEGESSSKTARPNAVLRTREDASYTCTRNPARMLDYVVCSESFHR